MFGSGFWDLDLEGIASRMRFYHVHKSIVKSLSFDRFDHLKMFSTSKDGFVRCLDFTTGYLKEVYCSVFLKITLSCATKASHRIQVFWTTDRRVYPTYHAQLDAHSVAVSLGIK